MIRKLSLSGLLAIFGIPLAHACSCFATTIEDEWTESKYVFAARIDHVETRPGEHFTEEHVQFTVLERLKGQPEELPHLVAPRTSCGVFMEPGEEWVIATDETGNVSMCGVSRRLGQVDHLGRPGLFGEIPLEQMRALKSDERNACAHSQVDLVEELIQLVSSERLSTTGWILEGADLENRRASFVSDTELLLELELEGCDRLARSLVMRANEGEPMVLMDFDNAAIRIARQFWPAEHAETFATLVKTEQFKLSQKNGVLRYEFFHPSLMMEMVYDVHKGLLKVAYSQ